MLIRKASAFRSSEITPRAIYRERRAFIRAAAAGAFGLALGSELAGDAEAAQVTPPGKLPRLANVGKSAFSLTDRPTTYEHITTYGNFYETGLFEAGKIDASKLRPRPWKVAVEGLVAKPATLDLDEFLKPHALEERIYRHRCVETWSAIIPWVGISLADVIKRFEPLPQAQYVEFTTLYDVAQLPGQRGSVLRWPYVEGLRLDEANHPLAILAVGLYGEVLPNQNGAPLRLVVPWKYGFKSIKSIVKIRLVQNQPRSTWMIKEPGAYGFYANVNPKVDHPRWSQARERRLGEFLTRTTMPFNGYGDQVASLYANMDLKRNY